MAKKEDSKLPQAFDFQAKEGSVLSEGTTKKYSYFDLVSSDHTCFDVRMFFILPCLGYTVQILNYM